MAQWNITLSGDAEGTHNDKIRDIYERTVTDLAAVSPNIRGGGNSTDDAASIDFAAAETLAAGENVPNQPAQPGAEGAPQQEIDSNPSQKAAIEGPTEGQAKGQ